MRDVLGALVHELSDGAVVTDADIIEAYRHDRAMTVRPGTPMAVLSSIGRSGRMAIHGSTSRGCS